MFSRILLAFFVLSTAVSCSSKPEAAPSHKKPLPCKQMEEQIPVRPAHGHFLYHDGTGRPFGYIHCGKVILPIDGYQLKSGFSQPESWGIWTNGALSEMQIHIPHFMLNKDIALEIPVLSYAFFGKQQNFDVEFKINGKNFLRKHFDRKTPHSLKFVIPATLNRSSMLKLTIRFLSRIQKLSELVPKRKDTRILGFGFHFLKKENAAPVFSCGIFKIKKISSPDRNGIQQTELRCSDHLRGPEPPEAITTELRTDLIPPDDPAKQYSKGELLDLVLMKQNTEWKVICSRVIAPKEKDLTCEKFSDINSYYPPYKMPKNAPLPDSADKDQKKQIADDLKTIRQRTKDIRKIHALEERFQRAWLQRQKQSERIPGVISPDTGQEIERFQNQFCWSSRNGSFFALPKDYNFVGKTGIEHNIVALNSLHNLLRSCNIQLIVILIPDAWQIAARALVPEVARIGNLTSLQCASTLSEYGIEAVYPDDAVLAGIPSTERLFCYPDPRPETGLWKILADLAARRIARFGQNAFIEKSASHFAERRGKTVFGDHYRWPDGVNCGEHKNGETVESLEVFRNGMPFQPDPASRIIVIGGDVLNLPGPGHTFSGQLSKRLKYPVDELVLHGEVWFQNLAALLSRNSIRFLAGKQVCLLMLSPEMLTENIFPDIQEQCLLYARLRNKKLIMKIPFKTGTADFQPPSPIAGERLYRQKSEWNKIWKEFSRTNPPALSVRIEKGNEEQLLLTNELPANPSGKPFTAVIETACYPEQANILIVNGQKVPLLINTDAPHFRPAAVELPPDAKSVELKISGRQDNLILIRKILLYQ